MSYATDDAKFFTARHILYLCRARLWGELDQENLSPRPDAQRLADLEGMLGQLREDIRAVQKGDPALILRARVLYGRLVRRWYAPARS